MRRNLIKEILTDRVEWLYKIKKNIHMLKFAPEELKNNTEFIKDCISLCSSNILLYASNKIKSNINFFIEYVDCNPEILKYASVELKNNRNRTRTQRKRVKM